MSAPRSSSDVARGGRWRWNLVARPTGHRLRADAPDQVFPAAAEAFGDLRSGLAEGGGGQVEQQWAIQGGGELGGEDVQVGGTEVDLAQQVPDVCPRHGGLRSSRDRLSAV